MTNICCWPCKNEITEVFIFIILLREYKLLYCDSQAESGKNYCNFKFSEQCKLTWSIHNFLSLLKNIIIYKNIIV